MDFNADHFTLMGLLRAFRIDAAALDKRYRELQAEVHPDRFAHAGDTEKRLSLQWATKVNEAYQTLKKPLTRAQYLLGLLDCGLDLANNHALPTDFLIEQMEWREAVAEARASKAQEELEALYQRVRQQVRNAYAQLEILLDEQHDYPQAADQIRRLMFLEKLLSEIDEALADE